MDKIWNSLTADQKMGVLRWLLAGAGPLVSWLGWATPDQVGVVTANLLAAAGPAMIAASGTWAIIANAKSSIVKSIAAMPETAVKPGPNGTATITIHDADLAETARAAATPLETK